jgi:drug/metabolite transporter (DMT)-like permease
VLKTCILTIFALVAFALNSILCRLALGGETIDAVGFTAIRLISGAITLIAISVAFNQKQSNLKRGNWLSAFFLFAYAICFSLAYLKLTTATGALILFGSVQFTMIFASLFQGERPQFVEWISLILAFSGLVYLILPGLSAPPIGYSILMISAGIAWGFYTLRGKVSENPLVDTTGNFVRAVPMVLLIAIPFFQSIQISTKGAILAIVSGSVASGIGYSIWYSVLKHHTATRTATLQLSVPAIAAFGGVIFLDEDISLRLVLASSLILGGIGLAVLSRRKI